MGVIQAMPNQSRDISKSAKFGTCLIVEDSKFDQMMMKRVLSKSFSNIYVQTASTLDSARSYLKNTPISFILLDNNLPDGKGANFVLELAANPNVADIPVIIVSDWPSPFMWDKAKEADVIQVVNKSDFTVEFIRETIAQSPKPLRLH